MSRRRVSAVLTSVTSVYGIGTEKRSALRILIIISIELCLLITGYLLKSNSKRQC